jgi:hypothetical protein
VGDGFVPQSVLLWAAAVTESRPCDERVCSRISRANGRVCVCVGGSGHGRGRVLRFHREAEPPAGQHPGWGHGQHAIAFDGGAVRRVRLAIGEGESFLRV